MLRFVLDLLADYGLNDYYLELSTKDPEKYVGSDEVWDEATDILREVGEASGLQLVPDPGGAAFYGPKISVQVKDALGRSWQMSTIQLDFNMPDRFELEYTAADGSRQRPVLIHRALFGSIERFFGILTEHYAGAFPAWLAPVQVVGIPVADGHVPYLEDVAAQLKSHGIRVEVDASDDRMAKKIVNHTNQRVPFMLLAGDRDVEAGAVSFRFGDRTQINGVPRDEAVAVIKQWIADRENDVPTADLVKVSTSWLRTTRSSTGAPASRPPAAAVDALPDELPGRGAAEAGQRRPRRSRSPTSRNCPTRTVWWWPAASWSTRCSTSTRTTPGHLMVVPYRRLSELEDLTEPESSELMAFIQKAIRVIKNVSRPHGFNVGVNLGHSAGGSLAEHLHVHVVPRWGGDANFITIIGDSKVIPQLLRDTRQSAGHGVGNKQS